MNGKQENNLPIERLSEREYRAAFFDNKRREYNLAKCKFIVKNSNKMIIAKLELGLD